MLTWINRQGVRSDKGFFVQFTSRWAMEYREGENILILSIEDGKDPETLDRLIVVMMPPVMNWFASGRAEPVSIDEMERIKGNIREALAFQGLKTLFING